MIHSFGEAQRELTGSGQSKLSLRFLIACPERASTRPFKGLTFFYGSVQRSK